MPVIINDGNTVADTFGFKPAANTAKRGQGIADGISLDIHFKRDSNCGKTILHIMITKHREADVGDDCRVASGTVGLLHVKYHAGPINPHIDGADIGGGDHAIGNDSAIFDASHQPLYRRVVNT